MKYQLQAALFALAVLGLTMSASTTLAASYTETNIKSGDKYYLLTPDGGRRPYFSETAFLSYGFNNKDAVIQASEQDLARTEGAVIPPRDGKVICSVVLADKGTCYLITEGKKAAFSSEAVFTGLGFSFANAVMCDVTNLEATTSITSSSTAHRPGTLVQRNGTLYIVGKTGLLHVPSLEALESWGYSAKEAVAVNSADLLLRERLTLEARIAGELKPFEPIVPIALSLSNDEKFSIPFKGPKLPEMTESWVYSAAERSIHGYTNHGGIDFAAPRGTPVYAAADGYALSSSHFVPLAKEYNGKSPLGFGLGEFVQIWHPDQGVYTSYSHLSKVSSDIPYFKPECDNTGYCDPKVIYASTDDIMDKAKFIKRGTLIGYVGDTGLSWGYTEQPRKVRSYTKFPSWDETHLHFEMYTRDPVKFTKANRYDLFGIYGRLSQYTASSYTGAEALWKLDSNNKPLFAK